MASDLDTAAENALAASTTTPGNNVGRPQHTQTYPLPHMTVLEPTPDNIERVLDVVAAAFEATPLFLAFLGEVDNLSPKTSSRTDITQQRRVDYYRDGITRVSMSGATLVESGDFDAVAIWESPDFGGTDFSSTRKQWTPMIRDWTRQVKVARLRYLGLPSSPDGEAVNPPAEEVDEKSKLRLRPFWHFGFLARDPRAAQKGRAKVAGAVSAVILPFLAKARDDGVPIWLEATTETGVRMYEHFGFRLVETITVGRGRVGADGWFEEGGPGVKGYCLIYDSHLN